MNRSGIMFVRIDEVVPELLLVEAGCFQGFFDFGEVWLWPTWLITHLFEDFPLRIHEENGGVSFDVVFFSDLEVFGFLLGGNFISSWEIKDGEDELVFDPFLKGFLGEDFLLESLTGRAPIGAGEFDNECFAVFFGLSLRFVEVGKIAAGVSDPREGDGGHGECDSF